MSHPTHENARTNATRLIVTRLEPYQIWPCEIVDSAEWHEYTGPAQQCRYAFAVFTEDPAQVIIKCALLPHVGGEGRQFSRSVYLPSGVSVLVVCTSNLSNRFQLSVQHAGKIGYFVYSEDYVMVKGETFRDEIVLEELLYPLITHVVPPQLYVLEGAKVPKLQSLCRFNLGEHAVSCLTPAYVAPSASTTTYFFVQGVL
jgi:hypothetical protein